MRKNYLTIVCVAVLHLLGASLFGSVPAKIKYQGILKKRGQFITASKSMKFSITDINSTSVYWTSGYVKVDVNQGVFTYVLEPSGIDWSTGGYYLEVRIMDTDTVGGTTANRETVLGPIEEIGSAVYAQIAREVEDNSVSADKIQDGAVTDVKVSSVSWSKIFDIPSDLGAGAADSLGSHVATTTLDMNSFNISNVSTISVSAVISDNVDGYDISDHFQTLGISTASLRNDISAVSVSTGTLIKRSGDTMSGTLNVSTISAVSRISFLDGTAITTAVGIGGAGDNLGTHTATATLDMAGHNIVNLAGYDVSQQFISIAVSTGDMRSDISSLETAVSNLENKKYNKTGGTVSGNISNLGYKIFTSSVQFADGTMLSSTMSLSSLSDNLGNHTANQDLNMSSMNILNPGLIDGYNLAYQFANIDFSTAVLNNNIFGVNSALDIEISSRQTADMDIGIDTGTLRSDIYKLSSDTISISMEIADLKYSTASLDSMKLDASSAAVTYLHNSSATATYLFKGETAANAELFDGYESYNFYFSTGGAIFGDIINTGYSIYAGTIQFADGTLLDTTIGLSDNLGNHIATMTLDMSGYDINLNGGRIISSSGAGIVQIGNNMDMMNSSIMNVDNLIGDRAQFQDIYDSTGSLRGSLDIEISSRQAFDNAVGITTDSLKKEIDNLHISTGVLYDVKYNRAGGTLDGNMNNTGYRVITSSIQFADGTVFSSTGTFGDNLGNHTATKNINMGQNTIHNLLDLYAYGSFVFSGSTGPLHIEGPGARTFWYPSKSAFRSGYVADTQWDDIKIGEYSFAGGKNTIALGNSSTAFGNNTNANADYSTALGQGTTVSGTNSLVAGYQSTVSGDASVALGYQTDVIGNDSLAMGYQSSADGNVSLSVGYQSEANGYVSLSLGYKTIADGWYSTALGYNTYASGDSSFASGHFSTASGEYSSALGQWVTSSADNSIILGKGINNGSRLSNNQASTLMVGFDRTVPTLFVSSVSVSVDNTSMTAGLNVSSINYVSRLGFADGTVMTSTKTLASLSDNLGNHTATQNLNMAGKDITNTGLVDGYDISAQFGDVATSTESMRDRIDEIGLSTSAIQGNVDAISMSTVTLREDIAALEVSTGTLLSIASAQDIYYEKIGGIISGAVTITSNVYTAGYRIYTSSIQFDDGTVIASTATLASLSDNLGNHTATQNLNMSGNGIVNVSSLTISNGGFLAVGTSGSGSIPVEGNGTRMMWYPGKAAFRAGHASGDRWDDMNIGDYSIALGNDTRAKGDYSVSFGVATSADGDYSTAVGAGTTASGNGATALGMETLATGIGATALGVHSTAIGEGAISMGRGSIASGNYSTAIGSAVITSNGEWSVGAGQYVRSDASNNIVLGRGLDAYNPLLNDKADSMVVGFGRRDATLFVSSVSVSVDNRSMTAGLNVSSINYVSRLGFADGTVMTSTATLASLSDNLGNHTATQNLNMSGKDITGVGKVDGYDISAQFGDVAGSTNSLKVTVNELGLSTSAIQSNVDAISMLTVTLREDIAALEVSTGTLIDKSSASLTYLFKNETASDSMKLGGYEYEYYATTASLYEVGFDTGTLSDDIYAIKMDTGALYSELLSEATNRIAADFVIGNDTGTLRTDMDIIIVSTGEFVKKTGDTMTGELIVSTINVISQITFADGSVITSSAALADNLGNHTATQNLNMSGNSIVNVSSLTVSGGGLIAMGTYGSGSIPLSGPGDRLMWYPAKVAFRAGGIDATQWNDNNIGSYSVAMGTNTTASGWYSTALGGGSTASGTCSTAFGGVTTASGYASTSFGVSSIASGNWSFAVGSVSKAMGQISAAFGADTIAEGDASVSMGYKTTAKGYGAVAMGMNTTAGGHNSVALGFGSTSGGNYSTAIGSAVVTSNGEWSVGIGQYVRSDASNNIVLGRGTDANNPLLNNKANSMVVGFDRTLPTLFVSSVSVSVDNTSMTAGLNVSSINYVSRLGFADGTVMTSTKTLASLSDNLGNHTATQDLNMNGKNITNAGLVDGYDISGQFGEVATSTNALNTSINELAVSTGTLLSNTSAQDIYYPRTGGTISGPVTITSNVYTSGYKIYTNSIQFDDGTVMTSTKTLASLSDNLGNHTATQDLNMNGKNITNAGLVDGYDISGQFEEVATSTNALNTSISDLALSTGAIQNDVNEVAFSTGPLRDNITALEVSTGTLLDKSSATVTYLYKNEQANDSERLGGYGYGYYATTASLYDIVQDTITLGSDLYAVKTDTGTLHDDLTTEIAARIALDFAIGNDTGTLRSDINKIIVSTGDFVKKTGDTMTGELSVSTLNVISQISFADGSIITSSSTLGDNLGNHTATQDLNMNGKNITNTGLVDGYDISAQFGDVAGSTNSLKVMVNELGLSTGALSGDVEAMSMSTATLREDIVALEVSTGTLLDKSSATLTYLFKNETASDSMKLGGYEYEYYATTASIYEIGVDTGILSNDVYALKMDTGTLRTDMDVLAFSTGTLLSTASASAIYYPISGGNINGAVTVSSNVYVNGYRLYISSIQFADGTVIDSTASLIVAGEGGAGDNLGNHIASKNINLSGYGLFNVSSITLAGSILSTGTIGDIPAQGAGTRFMWYPGKAALRAGSVTGTQWDDANVGNYSIGIGQNVIASQSGSFALGKNIFNSTPDSFAAGFGPAPGLFVAGSSVAVNSTSFPAGNSISFYTVGAMLNSGTFGSGNSISAMTGIRMLWYPKLASFRVGGTDSTQWDHSNIGQYSFAAGYNTLAKGNNSVAMGIGTEANGLSSIAFGSQSIANGNQATAMGNTSFASGQNSTAIGNSAYASGYDSAAIGSDARATGHTSLSLGQYVNAGSSNTVVIGKGAFWNDPLINNTVDTFMVGFNRNKPSFTVFQSSINVDASAGFIEDVLTVSTGNVTVARIQGDGNAFANGAWNGAGADYAEWFRKEGQIETGDIVGLNASSGRTRRYEIGDVLIGVCSERPAFVGNRDLGKTEQEMFADYALVGLVGQVDIKMDQVSVTGNKVATKDGKQIGYLMEDGKIFIRIKD